MNEEMSIGNSSYLSYEINGTSYIVQTISGPTLDALKITSANEEQNSINIIDQTQAENEEVSIVCLDGRVYAFHNGELQELDFSQIIDQNDPQERTVLLSKEVDSYETRYITNEDLVIANVDVQSQEQYEVVTEQTDKNFIVEKANVNANDFVEIVTAFKCKICTYTTQDKTQLLQHFQKTHVNPKADIEIKEESENTDEVKLLYMCGECSNCFPSLEDCKEHMINDHQLTDTGFNKGGKENMTDVSKGSGLLNENMSKSLENNDIERQAKIQKPLSSEYMLNKKMVELIERNVKCSYRGCPYKFSTEEAMQQHGLCHVESLSGTTFKCTVCRDLKFTKWKQCSIHLWKKHQIDIGMLTCTICKAYKSATMVKLLTHMRVHSETREYECTQCGKCFKQASQLRNHRVMHLDRKTLEVTRWYTSKKCDMCGKIYANSKCLKSHIQAVHSKLRPYVCNVCGHSSARKAMLQMHLRQHTGDKPFSCELCEYKTGDHNTLRRHTMQHTGFRPYKCPHCSYTAIQSSSYKNHLKSRHPLLSGLYTCDLCPFKTVKNSSYVQHVRDHEKGLIKSNVQKKDGENVEVFPGNIAAAQLIYSCLGAFSKVGDTLEANLMSSSTSADGTSQTITIQIPSKHLEGSLPTRENETKSNSSIEQEDEETMHCFLKIPREEEESIDTGGITIPAEPEESGNILQLERLTFI
ncbi:zinc finger protein 84-like [Hylaeus volcanicus]|uniref:zinc finger protein 84-like n=1 Tax=Hylaeus volcanicus TaxID=313075 RepID=UPI0023B8440D|nr:zinc finger protein 84-like [Hylaeus volcanicus]XP_053980697.1 zinc finger protein 84-like [Hylaeus volcanicus]